MTNLEHQKYRNVLAEKIRHEPSRERRRKILEQAQGTEEYKKADIYAVQKKFRDSLEGAHDQWRASAIELDLSKTEKGTRFSGATGEYELVRMGTETLLDSIVKDQDGREFFITPKMPREQSLASLIGRYLTGERKTSLSRLHFPEIRLENINGQTVALMECFRDFEELPYDDRELKSQDIFSEDEKAFLETFNLWIGNWDYKSEHVLTSKNKSKIEIGLIDLEQSFDFEKPDRLSEVSDKSVFLGDENLSDNKIEEYVGFFQNLDIKDRNEIIASAVRSGFEPEEVIKIVIKLFKRRNVLRKELNDVRALREVRSNIL